MKPALVSLVCFFRNVCCALTIASGVVPQESREAAAGGFVPLFNGVDLTGWHSVNGGPQTWSVRDGMIVCTGKPICVLRTDRQYENFVLELEWRHMKPKGNAGVFVWSDPITAVGQPYTRGIEIQVLDGRKGDWYTSHGDVFPIHGATMVPDNTRDTQPQRAFPTEERSRPSPEWNHYRIECRDGSIRLAVNGKVVTTASQASPRKGYICLESEGSPVHFRNLRIQELPSTGELPPEHVANEAEGFVALYNGVDFTGWKYGATNEGHWKANDWRIDFDGEGDHLWTEKSYGDFVMICDWRWTSEPKPMDRPVILPSGKPERDGDGKRVMKSVLDAGDSGIYLRGSQKNQVNMWCWPIGSGEVYGYRTDAKMSDEVRAGVTPRVVADAPIGRWNRFVITMIGDRLNVVLNGRTVIDNAQLPGIAKSGPIALQKHGAPIQFANIYIKEL